MKSMKMMMVEVLPMKIREGEGDVVDGDGWRKATEEKKRSTGRG